MKTPEARKNKH